jgi:hypothetical protein
MECDKGVSSLQSPIATEQTAKLVRDAFADKGRSLIMANLSEMDAWISALDWAPRDLRMLTISKRGTRIKQSNDGEQ